MSSEIEKVMAQLAEPFPVDAIGFRPTNVKGNRALALAYIDARNVMDRLDKVVGFFNWYDKYHVLDTGSVICTLGIRLDGDNGAEWIFKEDVGSPSEQPDPGDRLKAAFSDSLKRAAVKFGIGRYLYSLPTLWADYDPIKKQFIGTPRLPDWAVPGAKPKDVPKKYIDETTLKDQPINGAVINSWAKFLAGDPNLDLFTRTFNDEYMSMEAGPTKTSIKDMIDHFVKSKNWGYNSAAKAFMEKGK